MFSLGTETDGLFRTLSGDHYWSNDFLARSCERWSPAYARCTTVS